MWVGRRFTRAWRKRRGSGGARSLCRVGTAYRFIELAGFSRSLQVQKAGVNWNVFRYSHSASSSAFLRPNPRRICHLRIREFS